VRSGVLEYIEDSPTISPTIYVKHELVQKAGHESTKLVVRDGISWYN
jgi:hypothetical protein